MQYYLLDISIFGIGIMGKKAIQKSEWVFKNGHL
jgi:hypothetical protein